LDFVSNKLTEILLSFKVCCSFWLVDF